MGPDSSDLSSLRLFDVKNQLLTIENADGVHEAQPARLGPPLPGVEGEDGQHEADREANQQPGVLAPFSEDFDGADGAPKDGGYDGD